MRYKFPIASFLFFSLFASSMLPLQAQLKNHDYTQQSKSIRPRDPEQLKNVEKHHFQQKRVFQDKSLKQYNKWHGQDSKWQGKKSSIFDMNKQFQSREPHAFQSKIKKYPLKKMQMYEGSGKTANMQNIHNMRELVMAKKFQDANRYQYPVADNRELKDTIDKLSLSDINRYNFQRNTSTKDGFPVQSVGAMGRDRTFKTTDRQLGRTVIE